MDMTGGIIDRFRTMAIARSAVFTGHVLASMVQTLASLVIVIGVAVALGFRPTDNPVAWLAIIGMLALFSLALIWLATALGLAAKSVETASNTPMFLPLLPFLGSGFVPTTTMPAGLRQFAEYQPFTPVTETVRGLLTGTPIGDNAIAAAAWSVGIAPRVLLLGDAPLPKATAKLTSRSALGPRGAEDERPRHAMSRTGRAPCAGAHRHEHAGRCGAHVPRLNGVGCDRIRGGSSLGR